MNFNKVILIGRLTQDPQAKSLPSGQLVSTFGLATNRVFVDKSGQKQEQAEFHNIVVFGRLAEITSQYLTKGSLTMIEGYLRTRTWKDSQGNQRSKTEIVAQGLQMGPRAGAGHSAEFSKNSGKVSPLEKAMPPQEEIPIIEENEIDVKDIPF